MALRPVAYMCLLLGLGLTEARLLRAEKGRQAAARAGDQVRAGVRQIPISIPLRVPMFLPIDGPTLQGELAQDDDAFEPVPPNVREPEREDGPTLDDIMQFARSMGSPRNGMAPSFPVPADGVTIRMKAGEGMPAPLHMEETVGGLFVNGKLPENLNASTLKVSQLGHVVEVQYRVGEGRSAVGVNQRFELDFEPRELSTANYSSSSGQFSLNIPKQKDADKPREIVIAFENSRVHKDVDIKKLPKEGKEEATTQMRKDLKPEGKAGEKAKVEARAEGSDRGEAHGIASEAKKSQAQLMAEEAKARRRAASAAARASSEEATVHLKESLHALPKPLVMIEIDNN